MDWPDELSYREWDREIDGAWVRHGQAFPSPATNVVKPLSISYASQLWHWVFGSDIEVLPLIAKEKTSWLKDVFESAPIWFGGKEPPLQEQLRRNLIWCENDAVFFLTRRGTGYQASWKDFLRHCDRFPGWYNEGVLFHPMQREVAVFWEISALFVGRRSKRKLTRKKNQASDPVVPR